MVAYVIDNDVRLPPCGTNGGLAKAANSVQRSAMPEILVAYLEWRRIRGSCSKSRNEFARAVWQKHFEILDEQTIPNWINNIWEPALRLMES
jgi:hypothetical protein